MGACVQKLTYGRQSMNIAIIQASSHCVFTISKYCARNQNINMIKTWSLFWQILGKTPHNILGKTDAWAINCTRGWFDQSWKIHVVLWEPQERGGAFWIKLFRISRSYRVGRQGRRGHYRTSEWVHLKYVERTHKGPQRYFSEGIMDSFWWQTIVG